MTDDPDPNRLGSECRDAVGEMGLGRPRRHPLPLHPCGCDELVKYWSGIPRSSRTDPALALPGCVRQGSNAVPVTRSTQQDAVGIDGDYIRMTVKKFRFPVPEDG